MRAGSASDAGTDWGGQAVLPPRKGEGDLSTKVSGTDWARHWCYERRDLTRGRQSVACIILSPQHLLECVLVRRTLRRQCDNLRMLGAEVVRRIQENPQIRKQSMQDGLRSLIDDDLRPLVNPPASEADRIAFEDGCRKLCRFISQ